MNDNVEFRIILIGTTPDGEETRRDVTNEYILQARNIHGHPSTDMSQITFRGVTVTSSRRAHVNIVRATMHR